MAHSLFEPVPEPFHEKLLRRVRDLRGKYSIPTVTALTQWTAPGADRSHLPLRLDARGRQLLLRQAFETNA